MKKQPTLHVKASIVSASCSIYASVEMACPICRIVVPAKTRHTCGDGSTEGFADAIVDALAAEGREEHP